MARMAAALHAVFAGVRCELEDQGALPSLDTHTHTCTILAHTAHHAHALVHCRHGSRPSPCRPRSCRCRCRSSGCPTARAACSSARIWTRCVLFFGARVLLCLERAWQACGVGCVRWQPGRRAVLQSLRTGVLNQCSVCRASWQACSACKLWVTQRMRPSAVRLVQRARAIPCHGLSPAR